jgi:hypothetical protein
MFLSTVPFEYPYYEVVRREVSFLPMPHCADSSSYRQILDLNLTEDSLYVIVEGELMEIWKGWDNPSDIKESLSCDSVERLRDSITVYSSIRFEFDRQTDEVAACDLITGMRYSDQGKNLHSIDEILSRFNLEDRPYRLLSQAGSLVNLGFKRRTGMMLINLATGSVITMEMRKPVKSKKSK